MGTLAVCANFLFAGDVLANNNICVCKHRFRDTIYVSSEERLDGSKRFDWQCNKPDLEFELGNKLFGMVSKEERIISLDDEDFNKIRLLAKSCENIWSKENKSKIRLLGREKEHELFKQLREQNNKMAELLFSLLNTNKLM